MNKLKILNQIVKPIKPVVGKAYTLLAKRPLLRKYIFLSSIAIETSSICNLRCPGCYRTSHDSPGKNKTMSLQDFKLYIDQLPSVFMLILHGYGEPTINPDLIEMVKYAYNTKKFNYINFVTNALARKPTIYEELFANGLSDIRISVDSLNQQEADQLRPGTNVELLEKNLTYLLGKFADKISIITVVSNVNILTIQGTIERLIGLGAKTFKLQPYEDLGNATRCLSDIQRKSYLRIAEDFKLSGINIISSPNFKAIKTTCYNPYFAPAINVEGYLTPCCRIMNEKIFNFGNLKKTPFKELYFSKQVDAMQEMMKHGKYPGFCEVCPSKPRKT
jgi:radical SAM protein with 4Fe4S-binding SPASM domain